MNETRTAATSTGSFFFFNFVPFTFVRALTPADGHPLIKDRSSDNIHILYKMCIYIHTREMHKNNHTRRRGGSFILAPTEIYYIVCVCVYLILFRDNRVKTNTPLPSPTHPSMITETPCRGGATKACVITYVVCVRFSIFSRSRPPV